METEEQKQGGLYRTMCCSAQSLTPGTSFPSLMISCSCRPRGVPFATSSRSRSPADRWVKPKSCTARPHCVPFPLPGPPEGKEHRSKATSLKVFVLIGQGNTPNTKMTGLLVKSCNTSLPLPSIPGSTSLFSSSFGQLYTSIMGIQGQYNHEALVLGTPF